jgi:hypothetical protein
MKTVAAAEGGENLSSQYICNGNFLQQGTGSQSWQFDETILSWFHVSCFDASCFCVYKI